MEAVKYECKGECGYKPSSTFCLIHQLRKLSEEVAEVFEAYSIFLLYSENSEKAKEALKNVKKEWKDVKTMIKGIEEFHPWIKE